MKECDSCAYRDSKSGHGGLSSRCLACCESGISYWKWVPAGALVIEDEKPGLMTEDRRCKTCLHQKHCWGDGMYDEYWDSCVTHRADRRVENTVLKIHDEQPGLR